MANSERIPAGIGNGYRRAVKPLREASPEAFIPGVREMLKEQGLPDAEVEKRAQEAGQELTDMVKQFNVDHPVYEPRIIFENPSYPQKPDYDLRPTQLQNLKPGELDNI